MVTPVSRADVLTDILHARRSVRGFKPEPASQALLDRIFTLAQQAPSNCNVQPWVVHVVSGEAADRMRQALHEAAIADRPPLPDIPLTGGYPGLYRDRQVGAAKALFAATGVGRGDLEARRASYLRNFLFFDAPHASFILMPPWAGHREAADCGMYAQSLMLALTAHGMASCAQGALSHHADVVKRELGVDPDLRVLFGLAFGYEDEAHPANAARTEREPLDSALSFHR